MTNGVTTSWNVVCGGQDLGIIGASGSWYIFEDRGTEGVLKGRVVPDTAVKSISLDLAKDSDRCLQCDQKG